MATIAAVVSALGGAGAILVGLIRVASAIFRMVAESKQLRKVVLDNTAATQTLSAQYDTLARQDQTMLTQLADHEHRITTLERPHA